MRILIAFVFLFFSISLSAQVWKGAGIMYTQSAPSFDAPNKGSWVAVDTSSGYWYEWDKSDSVWVEMGARIQFTGTTGPPNYTPDQQMSRVAVNSGDSLYVYQTPSWSLISGGAGGASSDNQVVDTFTIISNTLRLSLEDDAQPYKSVDLSPYLDDTDTQLTEEQVEDYAGGMVTGNTETRISVTYQDGDGTLDFVVEQNLSNYTNDAGFLTSEVDGSTSNELQVVDTLLLSGTTLGVSLSSDGVIQKTVDLSSLQDGTGTDDQTLTIDSTASWYTVSIEDGNSVSFAKSAAGSDTQDLSIDSTGTNYTISLVDGGSVSWNKVTDTDTDTQDLSIDSTGTNYTISLVDGGSVSFNKVTDTDTQLSEEQVEDYAGGMVTGNTETLITVTYQDADGTIDFVVDNNLANYSNATSQFLTSEVDGSTSNEIQTVDSLGLTGTTLGISLSSDGVVQKTVDLASLQDGTGTDDQNLSVTGSGPTYVLDIEDGNDVTISASGIATLSEPSANELRITATEVDGSTTNELQTLSWSAGTGGQDEITLSDGGGTVTITDDVNDADASSTNEIQDLSYTAATGAIGISSGTGTTIPVMTASVRGLTPDGDGSGTDEYLREDGTWAVPPDLTGTDDQGLTIGGSGPTYTIDIEDGADVTIAAGGIATLSEGTANVLTITATEVDGSTTNEIQDLGYTAATGALTITSGSGTTIPVMTASTRGLTPDGDGSGTTEYLREDGAWSVPPDTDTDDQGLTIGGSGPTYIVEIDGGSDVTIEAAGISTLSEGTANVLTITSTEVDGSTSNELQNLSIGGSGPTYTIDVSNGDDVTIAAAGIATLSEGTANVLTVTATEVDGSTTNEIQDLSYTAATGAVGISGGSGTTIPVMTSTVRGLVPDGDGAGTDEFLREDGTWAVPPGTDTDDQNLTIGGSGPSYIIEIDGGSDVTVSAGGIVTLSEGTANVLTVTGTEVDGSTTNEIQTIDTFDISSNTLRASLSSDGQPFKSVDLSPYLISGGVAGYLPQYTSATALDTTGMYWNGYVGIGTSAPTTNLEVSRNQNAETSMKISNTTDGTGAYALGRFTGVGGRSCFFGEIAPTNTLTTEYQGKFVIEANNVTNHGVAIGTATATSGADIKFYTGGRAAANNRMTILNAGSVGIGTSSPDRLLHTEVSNTTTNAVTYAQRFSHITSSGTVTTNFGVGLEYELENASGTNRVSGTEAITFSDATNATEDATYTLQLIRAGSLASAVTILSTGDATFSGDVSVPDEAYGAGWNASTEVPTKNAVYDEIESLPTLAAGTYTPTLTGTANVASSTAYVCQYMRVGTVVTVSGKVEITPTTANTYTELGMTLPVSSNLTTDEQCSGSGGGKTTQVTAALIMGDATNDRAEIEMLPGAGSQIYYFTFTYQVL